MTIVLVALVVAIAVVVIAAIARDVLIRSFADRADARVKRVSEAETKADAAMSKAESVEKKIHAAEKLLAAQASRALRR